jgi:hypothetical protein
MAGMNHSGGETAQNAPATVAVLRSSISTAMCIISQMVARLSRMCISMMASAAANVSLPKTRKTPAMRVG